MRSLLWSAGAITIVSILAPASVAAQHNGWTASAGRYVFEFRDVSRHRRPVDASPITWKGSGPSVLLQHERANVKRSHRLAVSYSSARHFSFVSPIRAVDSSPSDRATALEAAYEYRRYPLNDFGLRGFDVGFGVTAAGGRLSLTREYSPAVTAQDRRSRATVGGVMAARLRRWQRLTLETWWVNGLTMSHRNAETSSDAESATTGWGGGWYDEWWATARMRLTTTTSLVVAHALAREYFTTSHMSNTAVRRALVMGVAYAR